MPRPAVSDRWFESSNCSLDDFRAIVEQTTDVAEYPHATRVEQGVIVYAACDLRDLVDDRSLHAEIAAALDITESTVRVRIHRARQRLRTAFGRHAAEGGEVA